MRNLRLYNTDAAFKAHEQAAGGDGNDTVTVVPGVSMSKDVRKRYFNPHDSSILVFDIPVKCVAYGTETVIATKTKKIRAINNTSADIYFTPPVVSGWGAAETYGVYHYPQDTAATVGYKTKQKITLIYYVEDGSKNTKIYTDLSGWSISDEAFFSDFISSVTINKQEIDTTTFLNKNGNHTFNKNGLNEIVLYLKKGVNWVPTNAFKGVSSLVSIDISCLRPSNFNGFIFAAYCFCGCTSLSSVTYSNWVNNIIAAGTNVSSASSSNIGHSFEGCGKLKHIADGSVKVRLVGNNNFAACSSLMEITLVDGSEIPSYSFCGCTNLQVINGRMPNDLSGQSQFRGCSSLRSIEMPNPYTFRYKEMTMGSNGSVILGPEKTSQEFTGFISIGSYTFSGCSELELSVNITPYPKFENGEGSKVTGWTSNSIGESAFDGCKNMTGFNFQIMSAVTTGTTKWDSSHTHGVWVFTPIYVSNAALVFNERSFNHSGLKTFSVPSETNLANIPIGCFGYSTGLTAVTLPSTVSKVNNYAFYACSSLESIRCLRKSAPTLYSQTFYGVKTGGILKYPSGSAGNYGTWLSASAYYLGYYNWTGQTA